MTQGTSSSEKALGGKAGLINGKPYEKKAGEPTSRGFWGHESAEGEIPNRLFWRDHQRIFRRATRPVPEHPPSATIMRAGKKNWGGLVLGVGHRLGEARSSCVNKKLRIAETSVWSRGGIPRRRWPGRDKPFSLSVLKLLVNVR